MHILHDDWTTALADIAAGLRPGGTLVFDTRNPAAEAWRGWAQPTSERDTVLGRLRERTQTTPPDADGVVTMHCHNNFLDDGGVLDVRQQLQFRTLPTLQTDLAQAGLTLQQVWGDWHHTPFTDSPTQHLMLIEATKE